MNYRIIIQKQIKKYKSAKQYWEKNWNQIKYIKYLLTDPNKYIKIIALYSYIKKYKLNNYKEAQWLIKRQIRAAKRLECFDLKRIKEVLLFLEQTADYKYTLETVEKYILEDLEKLKGEKPIITLKNGEQIYDIEKIKQLEKKGVIYYDNDKWIEK